MTLETQERQALEAVPTDLFIAGQWREASGAGRLEVEDPATGEALCEVADATPDDARAALDATVAAQPEIASTSPGERAAILERAYARMLDRQEELALLMTMEMGKALAESRAEIAYAAEFLRWFSGEALRIDGGYKVAANGASRVWVMRQPVGPSYLITPWNFPAAMGTRKIGPAVAAGCATIWKPASQTPLTALAIAEILAEAGLPAGALNVITSSSSGAVSEPVISDPRLRKLSFTGSTEVGRKLIAQSAPNVLRVSMELGGNAPFLVFDDADLDHVVDAAMLAKMRNIGEACTSANRFHVASSLAEEFSARLAERMGALRLGRGTEEGVEVGPLIDQDQRSKVAELVSDAVGRGAEAIVGGRERDGAGYFYEPTVLGGVPDDARVLSEEIFGPVAPVASFDDTDAAIAAANHTEYGLVAYVFTRDLDRARHVCECLETGMVGLNQGIVSNAGAPFGGVKHSGIGREGGNEGMEEFLETKYVAVRA